MQPGCKEADDVANEINRSFEIIKLLHSKTHISNKDLPHTKEEYDRILREAGRETDEYQRTHSTTDRDQIIQKAIYVLGLLPKKATQQHLKEIEEEQNSKRPRTSDAEGFIPVPRHLTAEPNTVLEAEKPMETENQFAVLETVTDPEIIPAQTQMKLDSLLSSSYPTKNGQNY
ncbi:hypothetical protein CEXT_572231 [Caerostris extrusa]|uniref:Uncharacterized protein n=1 Tax=Caerostris extrusa TaxID=172846 RepID=A0AAV4VZU5_CAEEX|nr:hypothetical protein CEXT_572231 [Caerostris extrusa]